MWRRDGSSEDELYIQCNRETTQKIPLTQIDSDDSENQPLITKSASKIRYNKRNVARKSIARKTNEPRNTLTPQMAQ